MKTLLLIDIQNDFLPGGALAVPEGDAILGVVNALQPQFDLVVATQDWHPLGHKSFASQHPGQHVFAKTVLQGLPQVLWPDHCVQGTWGAAFSPDLNLNKVEAVFRKGMDPEIDSYSGFYDNGHRKSTALAEYLKAKGTQEVYLVGLAADYCVYFSALDALQEDFQVFLVQDATRAIDPTGFERAKADLLAKGGKVISSQELLS
ncbi:bifunctional nicotinamidase/pyrazinamidase [Rufibacter glacialis]|uniref:Nicotinamidase n=1 Tax=Rufibacter glacialis TaxID=1259555 RepID=A0A5M8QGD9_9BACT|nr:bifunctional nicotinamidase/pyrazinamidase [Rufibacter glacialis]KAA6434298.1 bifunctional nicotinamidase/pyrazinamidase [Rufibacter glacialis]GGK68382.1 bifunctional pyrazinamidase/nicotinamidase [Rufibacter glacialis]